MKKLFSLTKNGQEIVSVEMDVPDFIPNPTLNRQWLRGVITTEVSKDVKPVKRSARPTRSRPSKRVKVAA